MKALVASVSISLAALAFAGCGGDLAAPPESVGALAQAVTAKVGDWNSCYEESDDVYGWHNPDINSMCLEQWGSFASSCGYPPNGSNATTHVAGSSCSGVGHQLGTDYYGRYFYTCRFGTFTDYSVFYSGYWTASTYTCNERPSAINAGLAYDSSSGNFQGSYTYAQAFGGPEGKSTYQWNFSTAWNGSGAVQVGAARQINVNTIVSTMQAQYGYVPSGTQYVQFCVTPVVDTLAYDGTLNSGTNVAGSKTCSSWMAWSTWSGPAGVNYLAAADVTASFITDLAMGSYRYRMSDTAAEGGSSYKWWRATDANGTNATTIATARNRELVPDDNNAYLKFCVTQDNGSGPGQEACSAYTAVGPLVQLYADDNYGGYNFHYAYTSGGSAHCYNLTDIGMNDKLSSFKWSAPTNASARLQFFQDINCSGDSLPRTLAAGGSETLSSIHTAYTTGNWNDSISSFRVVYADTVSASDVTISLETNYVAGHYVFSSTGGLGESGSTYVVQRADDANGTNTVQVGTATTYTLTPSDDAKYVRFCVTPSDGFQTGSQQCSSWKSIGPTMSVYWNSAFGGSSRTFTENGIGAGNCINLTDYGFNDQTSSLKVAGQSSAETAVVFFENTGCSGAQMTFWTNRGTTSSTSYVGDAANDSFSSFRFAWGEVPSASNVAVSIAGASATASYTYGNSQGIAESGSLQSWYRATDASGSNVTRLSTTTGTASAVAAHTLTADDVGKYLKFCVMPSDAMGTGAGATCSGWVVVTQPCGRLLSNGYLYANQSVTSCTNGYVFVMQGDGNLVEYNSAGRALWSTNTQGHSGAWVTMATDGNLIMYYNGTAIWQSRTSGNAGASLTVQASDGNVVIYTTSGSPVWATGT